MQTRTYPISAAIQQSSFLLTDIGTTSARDALLVADDGKYIKVAQDGSGDGVVVLTPYQYDNAIPLNSTLPTTGAFQLACRFASEDASLHSPGALAVAAFGGLAGLPALTTPTVEPGESPKDANWTSSLTNLEGVVSGVSVLAQFNLTPTGLFFTYDGNTTYFDYYALVVNFTLAGFGSQPTGVLTAESVQRNNFTARTLISVPDGVINEFYPASAYFEYTNQDPTHLLPGTGGGDGIGQAEIFTTTPKIITSPTPPVIDGGSSRARGEFLTAQIPSNFNPFSPKTSLTPGTTYYFRSVLSNADNTTKSAWATVTTPVFDSVTVY